MDGPDRGRDCSTTSHLALDSARGELSFPTRLRCRARIEQIVDVSAWMIPGGYSGGDLIDECVDKLGADVGRNGFRRRPGVSCRGFLYKLVLSRSFDIKRRLARRCGPGRPDALADLADLDPEVRRESEAAVRSSRRASPDRWDVYELRAHGVRRDHAFFTVEELRSRGSIRGSVPQWLERGGPPETTPPWAYPEIARLFDIKEGSARQHVCRTAEAIVVHALARSRNIELHLAKHCLRRRGRPLAMDYLRGWSPDADEDRDPRAAT